jgi:hypothetical protein
MIAWLIVWVWVRVRVRVRVAVAGSCRVHVHAHCAVWSVHAQTMPLGPLDCASLLLMWAMGLQVCAVGPVHPTSNSMAMWHDYAVATLPAHLS